MDRFRICHMVVFVVYYFLTVNDLIYVLSIVDEDYMIKVLETFMIYSGILVKTRLNVVSIVTVNCISVEYFNTGV